MADESTSGDNGKLLYCSFCGKSQNEVRKLIAGPSVFICDECVDLCNDIIREEDSGSAASETPSCRFPRDQRILEPVRDWPATGQARARGRRLQPLQASA